MSVKTPPMGWNSWNTFGENISENLIFETADAIINNDLQKYGYQYVVIDDCWSLHERDKEGRLQADPEKFPHGMKFVADYIHSKGLKFGMYSCAGNLTCAGYPGSYEHEFIDAKTFAEWGVDYLKYDYCYHSPIIPGKYLYRRMGIALKNCGRDILYSACSWGTDETHEWIKETGADIWRSTEDIFDTWDSVKKIAAVQKEIHPFNSIGCFNDMDMLIVGMKGKGNVGLSGCSAVQYKTHFSLWSFMSSPLMIGCDIRNMDKETLNILTNRDIIAIDQDKDLRQPYLISDINPHDDVLKYARLLDNGDIAVGLFNMGDSKAAARFNLDELGLPFSTGKGLEMTELWTGEKIRSAENASVSVELNPYDSAVYRAKVIDL